MGRLRPSTNKKFIGWWTFPYRRVTYYIRFTSKGIRILTIKGKKVVTGKTIRKVIKEKKPKKGKKPKGKKPKKERKPKGKKPKKEKKPKKGGKKPSNVFKILTGMTGTWNLKFPSPKFKFAINRGKITIKGRPIKLL